MRDSSDSSYLRYFLLKPYKNSLLSNEAKFWFMSMLVVTILTASIEGIVWSTIAYQFFAAPYQSLKIYISIAMGALMFTLIWFLDANITTYDFSNVSNTDFRSKFQNRVLMNFEKIFLTTFGTKVGWGIIIRVFAFLFIVFFTAPAVVQLIFGEDIKTNIEEGNAIIYQEVEDEIKKQYALKITELNKKIDDLQHKYIEEMQGTGGSKIKGKGEIANAIYDELRKDENERREYIEEREAELDQLRTLPHAQFQKLYGKTLYSASSFKSNIKAIWDIFKEPEYKAAIYMADGFVVLIFMSLLTMKLLQPRTVAIYLNARLQEAHDSFWQGIYDKYLEPERRSTTLKRVNPLEFEEWFSNFQKKQLHDDQKEEIRGSIAHRQSEAAFLENTLKNKKERYGRIYKEASEFGDNHRSLLVDKRQKENELDNIQDELIRIESSINNLGKNDFNIDEPLEGNDAVTFIKHRSNLKLDLERKRDVLISKKASIETEIYDLELKCENALMSKENTEKRLKTLETEIRNIESHLRDVRSEIAELERNVYK